MCMVCSKVGYWNLWDKESKDINLLFDGKGRLCYGIFIAASGVIYERYYTPLSMIVDECSDKFNAHAVFNITKYPGSITYTNNNPDYFKNRKNRRPFNLRMRSLSWGALSSMYSKHVTMDKYIDKTEEELT